MDHDAVIVLPVPTTETVDVDLEPRPYLSKNKDTGRLRKRMSLGLPILMQIPLRSLDGDVLEPYLRQEASASDFYRLHLVVNLRPDDHAPFETLEVGVKLSCSGEAQARGANAPIAWSLFPLQATEVTAVKTSLGLTSKLVIADAQATRTVEAERRDPYVVGLGVRESDFEWRFTGTRARPLAGPQDMHAVIKAPKGTAIQADLIVSASIRRTALGVVPHRANLDALHTTVTPHPSPRHRQ